MEEKIRRIWPGWEIDRSAEDNGILGTGSFGDVYRIRRSTHGFTEYAALKVITIPRDMREHNQLKREYGSDAELSSYYDDVKKSFESEYATMAALRGHANIVYCDDIRFDSHPNDMGWDIHIKMELLTPLMQQLPVPFSEADTRKLGMDICQALILCQKLDIIHRDIKPQNIFLARDGNFKLGDFGIAKHMEGTQLGTVAGTQNYMAPEVSFMQPYSCQADIYSLGLVMYWMLNNYAGPFLPTDGTKPTFSQKAYAQTQRLSGKPLPPPLYGSEALKKIVLKACAFDQKQRYASAAEMRKALLALDTTPAASTEEDRTIRDTRRKPNAPSAMPVSEEDSTVRTSYAHPGPGEAQKLVDVLNRRQDSMKAQESATYSYVPPKHDAVTATASRKAASEPYNYVPPKHDAVTATPSTKASPEPYHYVPPKQDAVTSTPPRKTESEPYQYVPARQEPEVSASPSPETYRNVPPKQPDSTYQQQTGTEKRNTATRRNTTRQTETGQKQTSTTTRTGTTKGGKDTGKKNPYAVHLITIAMILLIMAGIILSGIDPAPKVKETVTTSTGSDYYTLLEIGTIEDPDRKLWISDYVTDLRTVDENYIPLYTYKGEKIEHYAEDGREVKHIRVSYLGNGLYKTISETDDVNNLSLITRDGEILISEDACIIEWAYYQDEDNPRYLLVYTAESETADQNNYLISIEDGYAYTRNKNGTKYSGQVRVFDTFEKRFLPNQPEVRLTSNLMVCGNSIVAKNSPADTYELISAEGQILQSFSTSCTFTAGRGYLIVGNQGTHYVYDDNGISTYVTNNYIVPASRKAPFLKDGNKIMDLSGNVLFETEATITDYTDGMFVTYQGGKYGIVTTLGTVVIPADYDYISRTHPGYYYGKNGSQYSLLSADGVLVNGLKESPYNMAIEKNHHLFVINSRSYSLDSGERYTALTDGITAVRSEENGLYTVYDLFTGEPLLPYEYDKVSYGAGHLYAYRNNVWTVFEVNFIQ